MADEISTKGIIYGFALGAFLGATLYTLASVAGVVIPGFGVVPMTVVGFASGFVMGLNKG